jgi:hypothetical protein
MTSRIPKPKMLRLKKSLNEAISIIEKALPEDNSNYEYGNGGEVQIKPENAIDEAEHKYGHTMDPSEDKVNKADTKNMLGTGGGAALGAGLTGGNPLGAAAGGIVGNELTKPKPPTPAAPLQNSLDFRIAKCKAELQLKKAITVLEGYSPMSYIDLLKAFGSTEKIPDIMKEELQRPPVDWFENAIMKASTVTETPYKYAMNVWYGKAGMGQAIAADPRGFGEGVKSAGEGIQAATGGKGIQSIMPQNQIMEAQAAAGKERRADWNTFKEDEDAEGENVEKLIGGALMGGGIGALTGHPLEGAAIGAGAEEVGSKLLGKALDSADPTKLGAYIIHTLKAVAEPIASKYSPDQRKPKFDEGGESEVSGDGTKLNVKDLADKSKTEKTF